MSHKPTKAFLFRSLLPIIYTMIIKEGYKHEECAAWLRDNNYLDISQAMFTTYLNRHGDIEAEILRYQKYLEEKNPKWYEKSLVGNSDSDFFEDGNDWFNCDFKKEVDFKPDDANTEHRQPPKKQIDERVSSIQDKESIAKLVNSNPGPSPANNPYQHCEHPMEALRRKKALSNIPPNSNIKKGE